MSELISSDPSSKTVRAVILNATIYPRACVAEVDRLHLNASQGLLVADDASSAALFFTEDFVDVFDRVSWPQRVDGPIG